MTHEIQTIIEDIINEERIPVQIGSYVAPVSKESREWYIGMWVILKIGLFLF